MSSRRVLGALCALVCVVSGCSRPHSGAQIDAASGDDAAADSATADGASADASSDAAVVCADGDRDHDGICDGVDDCPDAFDPGQVDLDGDGVGWVCDPEEHVTVQLLPNTFPQIAASLHNDTFASTVGVGCTSTSCVVEIVAASPLGKSLARSDSGQPEDAWLVPGVGGALVTAQDQMLWSRNDETAGAFDVVSKQFTLLANGQFGDHIAVDQGTAVIELVHPSTGDFPSLIAPVGGQLALLAWPVNLVAPPSQSDFEVIGEPPTIAIPLSTPSKYTLSTYTPGGSAITLVDVLGAPATGLDDVRPLNTYGATNGFGELTYCIRRGSSVSYVGIRPGGGITTGTLPFTSCNVFTLIDKVANRTLVIYGQDLVGWAAVYVRDGKVMTAVTGIVAQSAAFALVGGNVSILTFVPNYAATNPITQAWALGSNGPTQLSTNLINVQISISGDTVHLVGNQPGSPAFGPVVLARYRDATGAQQTTIVADGYGPQGLVTTVEGAAVVGTHSTAYVVPSASTTPAAVNLGYVVGGARGTATVILATQNASHPTSQPALYAYDEVAGSPRLTQLTPEASNSQLQLLDPAIGNASTWFAYTNGTTTCSFAQLAYVGGVPALANQASCPASSVTGMPTWGVTGNGGVVVPIGYSLNYDLYLLGATGAARVSHSNTQASAYQGPVTDRSSWPFPIVGWYGADAVGGFACLASHPDRCWSVPIGQKFQLAASATSPNTDGSFALVGLSVAGTIETVSILRTMGGGDRPQPMP
jgi:hypothetical protein